MTRIAIDPNVRVRDNHTVVTPDEVSGPIFEGMMVIVFEPESGAEGKALVARITERLIYLEVDWASMLTLRHIPGGGLLAGPTETYGTGAAARLEPPDFAPSLGTQALAPAL